MTNCSDIDCFINTLWKQDSLLFTTLHDASAAVISGKNDRNGVAVWGKGGKLKVGAYFFFSSSTIVFSLSEFFSLFSPTPLPYYPSWLIFLCILFKLVKSRDQETILCDLFAQIFHISM